MNLNGLRFGKAKKYTFFHKVNLGLVYITLRVIKWDNIQLGSSILLISVGSYLKS